MGGIPADSSEGGDREKTSRPSRRGAPFGATIGGFLPQMDRTAPTVGRSFAVRVQIAAH